MDDVDSMVAYAKFLKNTILAKIGSLNRDESQDIYLQSFYNIVNRNALNQNISVEEAFTEQY